MISFISIYVEIITVRFTLPWTFGTKNGPSETCGIQPIKSLKWHGLLEHGLFDGCISQILPGPLLNTLAHFIFIIE